MSLLLTVVAIYILISLTACTLQRKLLYFPTKLSSAAAEQAATQEGFLPWKTAEGKTIGWRMPAKSSPTASVLVIHGNAGCALNRSYFAEPIHEASNIDVYILEYPGYGAREGSPKSETLLAAADEAFDLLPATLPRYVVSESLGTGIAAHLAKSRSNAVAGFAMFVPYNKLLSVAQDKMRFLPVGLILLDRYDPEAWLADYHGPIQFIVAANDEVIPSKFGLKLHESYRGPKRLELVPEAHHNDVSAQTADWWKNVFRFWETNRKR